MKKNTLLISILLFSLSIAVFLFAYYFYQTHKFSYLIPFSLISTNTRIYDIHIFWDHLGSSILTAVGLVLIIIYIIYVSVLERKKYRYNVLYISILVFVFASAVSLYGLISENYPLAQLATESQLLILFDFISFILTTVGLILLIVYTSKLEEEDRNKNK